MGVMDNGHSSIDACSESTTWARERGLEMKYWSSTTRNNGNHEITGKKDEMKIVAMRLKLEHEMFAEAYHLNML